MTSGSRRVQGLVAIALLGGCAQQPGTVPLAQAANFALGPNTTAAAPSLTGTAPVRLYGLASVPEALSDAANLDDGHVTGAQVLVRDATDGQALGQAVTYYDGSFRVDVPLRDGARAVIVTSTLVAKGQPNEQIQLMAPALLRAGAGDEKVSLTPGTTALVAFLNSLAALQAGQAAATPTIAPLAPGAASNELSSLIAVVNGDTGSRISALAEAAPELQRSHSLASLKNGIRTYVARLIQSQEPTK